MSMKHSTATSTTWTLKCTDLSQFDALQSAADQFRTDDKLHLRILCSDTARCAGLTATFMTPKAKLILDYSRQRVTGETMELLFDLADAVGLTDRINAMRRGLAINATQDRPVLHHLLRVPRDHHYTDPIPTILARPPPIQRQSSSKAAPVSPPQAAGNIVASVHSLKQKVQTFADEIKSGKIKSAAGEIYKNVLVLSTSNICQTIECLSSALASYMEPAMKIRFLSNIDPIDVYQSTRDLDPAETLVVLLSKSVDADCLLNARAIRQWGSEEEDFCAVSSNPTKCQQFGISRVFCLQEFVSSRFSWSSAIGLLPLSLLFPQEAIEDLLAGAHAMDEHFWYAPLRDNIPVILGLLGVWNSTFLNYPARAVLPYSQALAKFPDVVQHIDMESNGKRVALDGTPLLHKSAEINFGAVGSNCQHSFFQSLHQGRVVPVDFLGFMESSHDLDLPGEAVSNHDELMSHFFAQPDALAYGKTVVDLIQEGAPEPLRQHMVFTGNRPSSSLLVSKLDAYSMGALLAMYEHRTAVQGFVWGINSFDQFGLDLGKSLVRTVRAQLSASRKTGASVQGFNYSTSNLLEHYLSHGKQKEQTPQIQNVDRIFMD